MAYASVLLLSTTAAEPSTVVYQSDEELIRAADRIVRGQVVSVRVEEDPNGAIHTITTLAIAEDFSGATGQTIEIRELGGATNSRFLYVEGAATYRPGSQVLVMLQRTGSGRFRSLSMGMSKFDVLPSTDGDPILVRDMAGISVTAGPKPTERYLRLSRVRSLARKIRGVRPVVRSGAPVATSIGQASDSFTLLRFGNGLGARWIEADEGTPVRWYRDTTAPAPLASGADGSIEIETALNAWTTPDETSLRLTYSGATDQAPYGPWPTLGGRGAGVIFFEDPNEELGSNVLAIGGGGGTYNDGGTVNDIPFNRFTYGFVIIQNASALGANFRQSRDFARVLQHEIGHAIGLGHTPTDGTVQSPQANIMYPSCCSSSTPIAPALGPDDRAGMGFIYPVQACAYSATPTVVQVPAEGGGFSVDVATSPGCEWSVESRPAWVDASVAPRTGPGTALLVASTNATVQERTATLRIAGQPIQVVQAGTYRVSNPPADLNRDGYPDLLWHHAGNGAISVWLMNGTTLIDGRVISQVEDTGWAIVGSGDLDGDGSTDLVWQHADGRVSAWLMDGMTLREGSLFSVPSVADTQWQVRSVGDLDGDTKADLFWHHQGDGRLVIWLMDGLEVRQEVAPEPSQVLDTAWRLVGTADFDGDGQRDLLWHHAREGWVAVWRMNGLSQIDGRQTTPGGVPDLAWQIRAVLDLDADGHVDIIWQNVVDGRISAWLMQGLSVREGRLLTPSQVTDLQWRVVGPR